MNASKDQLVSKLIKQVDKLNEAKLKQLVNFMLTLDGKNADVKASAFAIALTEHSKT